ncbi:hybrid sensor histidine kinase/response regulator transcription factor [Aliikangiella coralliicola]|uniref:histidine kinase n=1 Tax=Aliikangiella coralliicola TaxID=2592383 RepID=A0A545UF14_9GAMM|nr:ATP-binding protein [Aliikangiella coralliicola]TQV88054.1 response regulator [Aliikangiella coralliicola]
MNNKLAPVPFISLLLLFFTCSQIPCANAFETSERLENNVLEHLRVNYKFLTPANNHKLSHPVTYGMEQDADGYLWIATADGLNRFNGLDNKIYRPTTDEENSLKHFTLRALLLDTNQKLWVGSDKGLSYYNSSQDNFKSLNTKSIHADTLSNSLILTIFEDTAQRLWIETAQNGLFLISKDRTQVTKIVLKTEIKTDLLRVKRIQELQPNQFLIATKQGILKLNIDRVFTENQSELSLDTNVVFRKDTDQIMILPDDKVLVGTPEGVYLLDKTLESPEFISSSLLSGRIFKQFFLLDEEKILLGTNRSGLFVLDLKNNSVKQFTKSTSNTYNLIDNQILSISRTHDGLVWIGTNLGINLLNEKQHVFEHYRAKDSNNNCLSGNTIYASLLDSSDNLWIGSFGSKLNIINLSNNQCRSISSIKGIEDPQLLKNIVSIYEDENGDIWIGTFRKGVVRYSAEKKEFEKLDLANYSDQKTSLTVITTITGNKKGKVWIASHYNGVYEFDIKEKKVTNWYPVSKSIKGKAVKAISDLRFDGNGQLWIATDKYGLWKLDVESGLFTHYITEKSSAGYIPKSLESLYIDSKNKLWINSYGEGIYEFSPTDGKVTHYSTNNGLLSNATLATIEDTSGNYWILTDKGLSKLSADRKNITTYLEKDGLQADSFTGAVIYDRKRNLIWTGGINGFNRFNPNKVETALPPTQVLVNEFDLLYKPVKLKKDWDDSPLKNVISETKQLHLKHNQNVFGFSFSSVDFLSPEKLKYAFILEGYDPTWNEVSADRRYANYTNIEPGQYIFKVKVANKEGVWSDKVTSLKINIAKPWWQTNLAYVSYFALSVIVLYLFISYRTKTLIKRSKELEKSVEERTAELALEKEKVEQLLSRKNEEFANVSHEFRTPLTLILGPVSQLLQSKPGENETKKLNIVQRNGYRLLRMVDQLLNLETFRVKSITQRSPQAIGKTIRMLAESFCDLAEEKKITFEVQTIDDVNFEFTVDAIEKITLNLLSNAVKYTQAGGSISISATRIVNNQYQIIVRDSGIGIPKDKLKLIFERFNRVHDERSEQVTGAGIGLALVKSLVESHAGSISVTSELDQGTTITVTLPIINEVENLIAAENSNAETIAMEMMSLTENPMINLAEKQVLTTMQEHSQENEDNSTKPTLLVIEDNSDMRDYISSSISDIYQVLTASDGEQGFQIAKEEVPDLIISDVMMPKMDGYETTRQLRQDDVTSHIPVILLTARGDRNSRLKGWSEKADEYLTKPFDVEELKIRLNNLLSIRDILKKRFGENLFQPSPMQETISSEKSSSEKNSSEDLEHHKNKQQHQFVERLNGVLEALYTDSTISIDQIAVEAAMSRRQLFRKLKNVLDMTPAEYLRRFRLEKAKQLLEQDHSVGYTAIETGFSSQSYFGKCFKAQFNKTPAEYQRTLAG